VQTKAWVIIGKRFILSTPNLPLTKYLTAVPRMKTRTKSLKRDPKRRRKTLKKNQGKERQGEGDLATSPNSLVLSVKH
jgi:hypothetical protein